MSSVPVAILELLLRYFGRGSLPNYERTLDLFKTDPYATFRDRLAEQYALTDITDFNSDIGWQWWINEPSARGYLRLSFVGPYAVVLSADGTIRPEGALVDEARSEGFVVLEEEMLKRQVLIWEPEGTASLYEFLFEFDQELPWE